MSSYDCLQIVYFLIATISVVIYTLFAPQMFFYNTDRKSGEESVEPFDRWRHKRLIWNLHQSFIHFIGSLLGFVALYILIFNLGIDDPSQYSLIHLTLLIVGIVGVMGFIPKVLFNSEFKMGSGLEKPTPSNSSSSTNNS